MKEDKLAGLLGLCRRAGRLTTGFDAVLTLAAAGKAALILTAADISEKSGKELRFALARPPHPPVPVRSIGLTKEEVGRVLGLRKPVGILATEDEGFARAFGRCLPANADETHDLEEETIL